ncbi:MAG TPA: three-Cys-motif partner protein TcmP [Nevskiales bacterium]|nr:three-Cys-motif partner protein TcmP [Nevskiales bacterium]
MRRIPGRDTQTRDLFPDLLDSEQVRKQLTVRQLRHPVWSHQKARLIELYLHYFVLVTKHGTYIDGFAGPQAPDHPESWAAKRVLECEPRWLRNFFFCELDPDGAVALQQLVDSQLPRRKKEPKRQWKVLVGDFNTKVDEILASGVIDEKQATFALLDQRTFECHWSTVSKLARHKTGDLKIELFYFLAVKWLHRALAGTTVNDTAIVNWWGDDSWGELKKLSQVQVRDLVSQRMVSDLGYRSAFAWPIYEVEDGVGSIMYYMIHATDHPDAPGLMWRAFNQATQPLDQPVQGDMFPFHAAAHD